ncbi:MAG: hypothetical protein M1831_007326 [Alyxoria varia]|nr:MAG: hypothetical protein M1831_007326 [Alyxoria varia]
MKYSSALAAAATFGLSAATWPKDAPGYSTPENTDTKCNSQMQKGYTFGGVQEGPMRQHGGLKFGGFDCKTTNYKRTFDSYDHTDSKPNEDGYGKCITGAAKPDSGPSMEAPDRDFSIQKMHLSTEFDTPIDCHYTMPNGETCKETHDCSSKGTTIENSQCGGAKHMSIALPKEHKSKSCHVSVHSIGFHCGSASAPASSYPATSATPSSYATPSAPVYSTPSAPAYSSTPKAYSPSAPEYTPKASTPTPKGYSPSAPAYTPSAPAYTPSSPASTPEEYPSSPASTPEEYPSSPASTPKEYPSGPASPSSPAEYSSPAGYAPPKPSGYGPPERSTAQPEQSKPSVYTTTSSCSAGQVITQKHSKATTSTITEVETKTITSCAETVTNCPAEKKTVTKVTTATPGEEYTTTLTKATVITDTVTATHTPKAKPSEYPSGPTPEQPSTPNKPHEAPEAPKPYAKATTCPPGYKVAPKHGSPYVLNQPTVKPGDNGNGPSGGTSSTPAPAPKMLPRCLNTFQAEKCKGNTDADCYCKNSEYITDVINCAVAHGDSKEKAAEAISYLQGICAEHVSNNPALVTAVPSTITVQPVPKQTQAPAHGYTTIPLPKYSTTLTVPKVSFTSGKGGDVELAHYGSSSPTQAPKPYGANSPAQAEAAPSGAAPGAPGAPAAPAGPGAAADTAGAAGAAGTPATSVAAPSYASESAKPAYTGAANKKAIGGGIGAAAGIAALLML